MPSSPTLAAHPVGLVVLVGLTWAFFQHLLSGVRHLVMDTGAGFELGTNKTVRDPDHRRSRCSLTAAAVVYVLGVAK